MNNIFFVIIITILYCVVFYYFIYSLYIFNGKYIETKKYIKYNDSLNILDEIFDKELFTRTLLKNNSYIILDIMNKYNNTIDNNIKYICYYNDVKIYCKSIDLFNIENYTNYIFI